MDRVELQMFLLIEKKYIEDAKWFEGLVINNDPGEEFVYNWVNTSAESFRDKWDKSCCRRCCFLKDCGVNLIENCEALIDLKKKDK